MQEIRRSALQAATLRGPPLKEVAEIQRGVRPSVTGQQGRQARKQVLANVKLSELSSSAAHQQLLSASLQTATLLNNTFNNNTIHTSINYQDLPSGTSLRTSKALSGLKHSVNVFSEDQ